MYFFSVIIIMWCLIGQIACRPSSVPEDYDKEVKDDSYEDGYKFDSANYLQSERRSLSNQFPSNEPDTKVYLQGVKVSNTKDIDSPQLDRQYLENISEDHAEESHVSRVDVLSSSNDVKRTALHNKDNTRFLRNNEKHYETEYDNDEIDESSEQDDFKQNDAIRNENRNVHMSAAKKVGKQHEIINRDRRQIKNSDVAEVDDLSSQINEIDSEDEETAIKRHIRKLSKQELDELLLSLSEDKRALLKNIIDSSQQDSDSIKKREITKKAGTNEENSFVGSEQSDIDKSQGVSPDIETESSTSNTEKSINTKKADSEICSKSTEILSSSEKSNHKISASDVIVDIKLEGSDNKENLESLQAETKPLTSPNSEQERPKHENKRELRPDSFLNNAIKIEESELLSSLNNEDSYCFENQDLSQIWNEESNINKRDISSENLDSIKSLEDSFPNVIDSSNFKAGPNTPLVRVKRTNPGKTVEKRDTNFISNLKVPYFSNAVDINEEDSDDSEFQDDGFFDRRTNLAKSGPTNEQYRQDSITRSRETHSKNYEHHLPVPVEMDNNLETSIVSLGSDNDAVLSGMEGADDNIMYNSISRNRRTAEESNDLNIDDDIDKYKQKNAPKLASENVNNEIGELCVNAPRYQENDAFGSLPRNYEEELARYKRIRRLKP